MKAIGRWNNWVVIWLQKIMLIIPPPLCLCPLQRELVDYLIKMWSLFPHLLSLLWLFDLLWPLEHGTNDNVPVLSRSFGKFSSLLCPLSQNSAATMKTSPEQCVGRCRACQVEMSGPPSQAPGIQTSQEIYLFIYLFIFNKINRERERDKGRGRSRLHAGSPMWDSIPGLQDHALGQRQMLNRWVTQVSPAKRFKGINWPAVDLKCLHEPSEVQLTQRLVGKTKCLLLCAIEILGLLHSIIVVTDN